MTGFSGSFLLFPSLNLQPVNLPSFWLPHDYERSLR